MGACMPLPASPSPSESSSVDAAIGALVGLSPPSLVDGLLAVGMGTEESAAEGAGVGAPSVLVGGGVMPGSFEGSDACKIY